MKGTYAERERAPRTHRKGHMQRVCTATSGPGGATRHEQGASTKVLHTGVKAHQMRSLDLTTLSWTIVSQVMMND